MKFYKYQGAGNDFLIADNREGQLHLTQEQIAGICDRRYGVGADGLMLLENGGADFRMVYYNADGSGGMMCGNGGRCMVAFAADLGYELFRFEAADGYHDGEVLSSDSHVKIVRLKMKDVDGISHYDSLDGVEVPSEGYFLETGTRHYVRFVDDADEYDVVTEGRSIRYGAAAFLPAGTNVNYVEPHESGIKVRTYEKGVEDETFACGTGIVASAIAAWVRGVSPSRISEDGRVHYDVNAKRDVLSVDFISSEDNLAEDVWLTGPATFVAEIDVVFD